MKHLRLLILGFCLLALHQKGMSQTIPNNDFENWTTRTRNEPDSEWTTSNEQSLAAHDTLTVWKVPGFSGQAIHIQTAIVGTDTMFAYATNSPNMGVPYTGQPSAITGYYRYNLPGNDSAIVYVEFYKAGVSIATNVFQIRGTGSLSTFTAFSLPLQPMSVAPDTVFIALASSNLMSGVGIEPASWIEFDQLAFTGTTSPVIVGGSFDSWTGITTTLPAVWLSPFGPGGTGGVSRSTTHYTGSYSAKLENQNTSFGLAPGVIISGNGFPYANLNDTLTGYYMYTGATGDTALVQASIRNAGVSVGMIDHYLTTAATWTYFEVPLNASSTPDSLQLAIVNNIVGPGTSPVLMVDHLRFKSQSAAVPAPFAAGGIVAYPNPVANDLYIRMPQGQNNASATITVFDATGRNVGQWNYNNMPSLVSIPVGALVSGVYVYEIRTDANVYKGNFLKK